VNSINGTNVGSVFFDVGFDQSGFNNKVKKSAGGIAGAFGGAFGTVAKVAGALFGTVAIGSFIKSSIELGSNLTEVQNVVDVTFGSMSNKINSFALTAMTSFGLSELAAKQYTGTMGAMLKSMGFSTGAAADMSSAMAGLAGDLASFYNIDQGEAFQKIRSGISGEIEPLRQLGINMSVANLQAYAMKKGFGANFDTMQESQKALIRYNYLMEMTKDAQGDFVRTGGGWANQMRVLKLQWDSFKSSMGQAFIIVLNPILQGLNVLIARLIQAGNAFRTFMTMITGTKNTATSTGSAAKAAASGISTMGDSTEKSGNQAAAAGKKASGAVMPFDELNNLSKDSGGGAGASDTGTTTAEEPDTSEVKDDVDVMADQMSTMTGKVKEFMNAWGLTGPFNAFVTSVKSGFSAVQEKAVSVWSSVSTTAAATWEQIVTSIAPLVEPIANVASIAGQLFMTSFTSSIQAQLGIFNSMFTGVCSILTSGIALAVATARPVWQSMSDYLTANGEQLKSRIRETWSVIELTVRLAVEAVSNTITTIFGGFTTWFNLHFQEVYNLFYNTWTTIGAFLNMSFSIIQSVFNAVFGGIADFLNKNAEGMKTTFVNTWNIIWTIISPIWNTIAYTFKTVFEGIKTFFDEHGTQMRAIVTAVFDFIWLVIKTALDNIKTFWDTWGTTIMAVVNGFMTEFKLVFTTAWDIIKGVFGGALDVIQGLFRVFKGIFTGDWDEAWEGVKQVFKGAWDAISSVVGGIAKFFTDSFTNVKNTLKTVWDGIVGVFKSPINSILGFINQLITAWNALEFKVPKVEVGGMSFGGMSVGMPKINHIPYLATGGIVDQPTLSMIGDGGKEAVLPLENNTGWMVTLANIIAEAITARMAMTQGNSSTNNVLKLEIDGREFGEILLDYIIIAAGRRGLNLQLKGG